MQTDTNTGEATTKPPHLTTEDVARLLRPFHANAIKFLPIGKLTANGSQQMMAHLDASLANERLSEVDPCWEEDTVALLLGVDPDDPIGLRHGAPHKCTITVKGVRRSSVGQLEAGAKADNKHWKAAESDAFKRAAWKFGVGSYLRAMPPIYLPQMSSGGECFSVKEYQGKKSMGFLKPAGKKLLRAEYVKVVAHAEFAKHYGEVVDYGDLLDDVEDAETVESVDVATMTPAQVETLVLLGGYTTRKTSEDHRRSQCEGKAFAKELAPVLNGAVAALGTSGEDTQRLRDYAIKAGEGDRTAYDELSNGLDVLKAQAAAEAGEPDA